MQAVAERESWSCLISQEACDEATYKATVAVGGWKLILIHYKP